MPDVGQLFRPRRLGCPTCNTRPNSHSTLRLSAFEQLANDRFRGRQCGHEFTLFDALKRGCRGSFGILSTFAHWEWSDTHTVIVGRLATIAVPAPADVTVFAAFLSQYSNTDSDSAHVTCFSRVLELGGPELLISTAGPTTAPKEALGTEAELGVSVYGRRSDDLRSWVRLLYESLTDYSEHDYSLAVFKLCASLEIGCDKALEAYLHSKLVPIKMVTRFRSSGRNWDTRLSRLVDMSDDTLDSTEAREIAAACDEFKQTVRHYRNAFAHDDPAPLDHDRASNAFSTSFPLLWALEKILEANRPTR